MKFKTESKSNEIQFIPLSETLVALLPHFDTFAHDWSLTLPEPNNYVCVCVCVCVCARAHR